LPVLGFDPTGGPSQAPRWITGRWSSSLPLLDVQLTVTPQPGFACAASMDPGRQTGGYSCDGLLPPATDVRLELVATSGQGGHARATRSFRTMAERLSGVPWFTEFEDPNGEALACAAASVRIIQTFTTGRDLATAREGLARLDILRKMEQSLDPDPGTPFARVAALETTFFLRDQLLRDIDWASMAHSLEVRVPLIDVETDGLMPGTEISCAASKACAPAAR